jgi:L-idonate 5-dehydrogenase
MRAFVLHGAEDIRWEEVPCPAPARGEVLVRVRAAGICGSDLHYYAHGRCGNFVPTRPFILGHEFSGEVAALGEGVTGLEVGAGVAVDPSQPCGKCKLCRLGRYNLCPEMIYFGSASVDPPRDGCYADYIVAPAGNCVVLPEGFEYSWGALLEPLSVAAHAVQRGGGASGKNVLITGGGTIGQMILKIAVAFGASRVVVSDLKPFARQFATEQGADATLDPADPDCKAQAGAMAPEGFDLVFEAAGAPLALTQAVQLAARGATVVQVGTLSDGVGIPANTLLTRELQYLASWRFANVFPMVVDMIAAGRIDVRPLVTHVFPFEQLQEALLHASRGEESIKVQIAMDT